MEHHLLAPLYELVLKERPSSKEALSAANLVGLRLLRGPYLGETYQSWGLHEAGSGRWVLSQAHQDDVVTRDVFEPFHRSFFDHHEEDDEALPDVYMVDAVRKSVYGGKISLDEHDLPAPVRSLADDMMKRLRLAFPDATSMLLDPTPKQLADRQEVVVEQLSDQGLNGHLSSIIGNMGYWSLDAYGIKYHNPAYKYQDDVYLLAHNGTEVCGMMCLGGSRDWGYAVRYISVCPGFQKKGLSLMLYKQALSLCQKEKKVLLRTTPGSDTPLQATLAYDRLVRGSPVVHATLGSFLEYPIGVVMNKGWDYEHLLQTLKPLCDDATPSEESRQKGIRGDEVAVAKACEPHGPMLDELLKGPPPYRRLKPKP